MEIKVHELEKSPGYPDGFKYSLIVIDPKTGDKILMDNHKPKGHHYHLSDKEYNYKFSGIDKLFEDFEKLTQKHLGVEL